ncbi:MAG: ABC transporter ATP-binding protein [Chthoniobacteraceae bacterium]
MRTVARVFAYLRRHPGMAAGTMLCAVLSTLMVTVFPKVTQLVVDDIRTGRGDRLWGLVGIAAAAFFARDALNSLRIILNNSFEQRVIFDLRSDLYSHIQRLPLRWFDDRATGDIMTRLLEDVTAVERMLIDGIEQGAVAVLQIIIVGAMLFSYHPTLAWFALIPVPFLIVGALAYTLTAPKRYRVQRKAASAMNALLHDNLAGIRQIKTFVREEEEHARFNGVSGKSRDASLRIMHVWALYNPSMTFLAAVGSVLVLGFGGHEVVAGRLGFGEFTAFLLLVGFLYDPIGKLHSLNQLVQSGRAAGERILEILDEKPEADEAENAPAISVRGDVEFEDVSFSYSEELPTLRHISLRAKPGETVALVGPTGAGKSTLVNLITRFYEYDDGEIRIDGTPLRDLPRAVLRSAVGMVTQESFLFNGTVRDNLRLGLPSATDAQMWQALSDANAKAFIERMPGGLDTIVGERGVKLSVGEKQRVSIARALLKDPPILVLDEATASVDTETERLIQQALDRLMEKRTSFVIAHRLSTVRHADQILVLERGRIVERGTHDDLLAMGGVYSRLCAGSFLSAT